MRQSDRAAESRPSFSGEAGDAPAALVAELAQRIAARQSILFVGAGLSESLGLQSWHRVIAELAVDLGVASAASDDANLAHPDRATIVKFHGDLDDVDSMVVTETDYFRRLAFEDPLDIKLNADAFGRSILFIGYSLSDVNLRLLLYRMRGIWLKSGSERHQPRSYIFMARPDAVQQKILASWGVASLLGAQADESPRAAGVSPKLARGGGACQGRAHTGAAALHA